VDSGLALAKTRFLFRRMAFLVEKSRIHFSAGGGKVDSGLARAKTRLGPGRRIGTETCIGTHQASGDARPTKTGRILPRVPACQPWYILASWHLGMWRFSLRNAHATCPDAKIRPAPARERRSDGSGRCHPADACPGTVPHPAPNRLEKVDGAAGGDYSGGFTENQGKGSIVGATDEQ
jgi:hypothetical protein